MLERHELRLIDALHGGFPLQDRPFAQVGATLGLSEDEVISMLQRLLQQGVLTRFGPLFQIERAGGRFVLAAMEVPQARFDAVAAQINALPEVAHNYRREHRLNMWFVVAAESHTEADHALTHIEALTGIPVLAFPKEREYFVELRLPLLPPPITQPSALNAHQPHHQPPAPLSANTPPSVVANAVKQSTPTFTPITPLTPFERCLMQATQAGLPITPEPYATLARQLDVSTSEILHTLSTLLATGVIRRIGAVPHHYRLGFTANGMSVWDVDDAQVDALGEAVGRLPGVSHCYRRPRHAAVWPYNLFAMLHGRSREEVQVQATQLRALLGTACRSHDMLFSSAVLKKTGLRLRPSASPTGAAAVSAVEG